MNNMKRLDSVHIVSCAVMLVVCAGVVLATVAGAQTRTLSDYGLSEESVKYLSPEEIQTILNSMTPQETAESGFSVDNPTPDLPGSATSTSIAVIPGTAGLPPNAVDCFDYYHFGSVQTDIYSQSSNAITGMDMKFTGTIKNQNTYPIVNGRLYVKIFKMKGPAKDANGPDVVDQFVVADDLTISANGTIPISFSWRVPLYARSGDYQIASFFSVNQRYNLLGLSFTDDVIGNVFGFTIKGMPSVVQFDKTAVTINGTPYFFAAYPPRIPSKTPATVSAKITNTTGSDEKVAVLWKLYRWDSMEETGNFVRATTTSVVVKAGQSVRVETVVPEHDAPVYYLIGELTYKDTKSILGIRFVRPEVDKLRINFPGITGFPIRQGVDNTVFSCVYNSGTSHIVNDARVELAVLNEAGAPVVEYTYQGPVTGEMMAVKKDFVPTKTLDRFSIQTKLYQSGTLVEQATIFYDCAKIDPALCSAGSAVPTGTGGVPTGIIALAGILVLIIVGAAIGFKIKGKGRAPGMFLFLLALVSAGFFISPSVTEAKSNLWTDTQSNRLHYFWDRWSQTGWELGLGQRAVQVTYNVEIRNTDAGVLVNDGDSVPVGARLTLKFIPHAFTDIYWFGTGYSNDSPYGEWRANAAPPPPVVTPTDNVSCENKDFVNEVRGTHNSYGVYIPIVVAPPTKTIGNTGGLTCGSLTGNETTGYTQSCEVTSMGTISPRFNFGATLGKFYYRYWDYRNTGLDRKGKPFVEGCYGNDVAMKSGVANPYILTLPTQTIAYSFTAVNPNRPPSTPEIKEASGITPTLPKTTYTFTASSTDPDGDNITYQFDWDALDGIATVNQESDPASPSGTFFPDGLNKSWANVGAYAFNVRARDTQGSLSDWKTYNLTLATPPPTAVTAVAGSCNSNTITVSWTAPISPGVTGYEIYRTGGTPVTFTITNPGQTTYADDDNTLIPGGLYGYQVSALYGVTESAPSDAASCAIPATPDWIQTSYPSTDVGATDTIVDGSHVYAVGSKGDTGAHIEKRDRATGNIVWSQTRPDATSTTRYFGVGQDSTSVYIVGGESGVFDSSGLGKHRWFIEKRDKNAGNVTWKKNGALQSVMVDARDVAVDGTGVYFVARVYGPINLFYWHIQKRNFNGTIAWTKASRPSSHDDFPYGIALDSTGVYVVGTDMATADNRWRIEKRSLSTGLLITSFGTSGVVTSNPSSASDQPNRIAVDSTGIYVVGTDMALGNNQWRIEKRSLSEGLPIASFGADGVVTSNPSSASDVAQDITVTDGAIYVAGTDKSTGEDRWRIEKRNLTTGQLIWAGDPGNGIGSPNGIATDGIAVYVAGYDSDSLMWRIEKFQPCGHVPPPTYGVTESAPSAAVYAFAPSPCTASCNLNANPRQVRVTRTVMTATTSVAWGCRYTNDDCVLSAATGSIPYSRGGVATSSPGVEKILSRTTKYSIACTSALPPVGGPISDSDTVTVRFPSQIIECNPNSPDCK